MSGGFSSLAFLDESYLYKTTSLELIEVVREHNGQETIEYEIVTREIITEDQKPSLNSFNLAGRLNLLFRVEHEIASDINLHIELYISTFRF